MPHPMSANSLPSPAKAEGKRKPFSRRIVCARGLFTTPPQSKKATKHCLPRKEGSGAPKGALSNQCPRQARPRAALWRRAAFRRSRLRHSPPASTRWLDSRTGFPAALTDGHFARFVKVPRLSTLRADRSLCRSTGDPKPPECGAATSARGHRSSLSSLRHAFRKGALGERDSVFVPELETNVNENVTAASPAGVD